MSGFSTVPGSTHLTAHPYRSRSRAFGPNQDGKWRDSATYNEGAPRPERPEPHPSDVRLLSTPVHGRMASDGADHACRSYKRRLAQQGPKAASWEGFGRGELDIERKRPCRARRRARLGPSGARNAVHFRSPDALPAYLSVHHLMPLQRNEVALRVFAVMEQVVDDFDGLPAPLGHDEHALQRRR